MTSYIGIDVGKKSLHIYLSPIADKFIEITNNSKAFVKLLLLNTILYLSDIIIVFETTGGYYERELREYLLNKAFFVNSS